MADPYATRAPDLSGRPAGPPAWQELIAERGGTVLGAEGAVAPVSGFAVVDCRGIGALAPFAWVDAPQATLLWIEHTPAARSAAAANELLELLRGLEAPIFAIKQGAVGGPPERPGCFEIDALLVSTVLDAALSRSITWERDSDFGYEVPAHVPDLDAERSRALLPRLLYGDHDRVYEHAGLVAAKKRERAEIAGALTGLDPAIGDASGWPPAPSPSDWRD